MSNEGTDTNTESRRAVTVYGASSPAIDTQYMEQARLLGALLARHGLTVVNGGGRSGLMAAATEGAASEGGETIGVLPGFMIERGWNHPGLSQTVAVDTMHERKALMATMSRAAIALPGGVGTLEELLEIITWRQLGLYSGHVIILNINGYYNPLLQMLEQAITQRFMNPDHRNLFHVATTPQQAVDIALRPVEERHFTQKII